MGGGGSETATLAMSRLSWDEYFLKMAQLVSERSKDRSTQVGAVLVGQHHEVRGTGYNGFPRGVNDDVDARHERPEKYLWTAHAERNAIDSACLSGTHTEGCTLYINFSLYPCPDCMRGIIQSGIVRVVGVKNKPFTGKGNFWLDSFKVSKEMAEEAGIECVEVEFPS